MGEGTRGRQGGAHERLGIDCVDYSGCIERWQSGVRLYVCVVQVATLDPSPAEPVDECVDIERSRLFWFAPDRDWVDLAVGAVRHHPGLQLRKGGVHHQVHSCWEGDAVLLEEVRPVVKARREGEVWQRIQVPTVAASEKRLRDEVCVIEVWRRRVQLATGSVELLNRVKLAGASVDLNQIRGVCKSKVVSTRARGKVGLHLLPHRWLVVEFDIHRDVVLLLELEQGCERLAGGGVPQVCKDQSLIKRDEINRGTAHTRDSRGSARSGGR